MTRYIVLVLACVACFGRSRRLFHDNEPPRKLTHGGLNNTDGLENWTREELNNTERPLREIWHDIFPPNATRLETTLKIILAPIVLPIALIQIVTEQLLVFIVKFDKFVFNLLFELSVRLPSRLIGKLLNGMGRLVGVLHENIFSHVWRGISKVAPHLVRAVERALSEVLWLLLKTLYHTVVFIFRVVENTHKLARKLKFYELLSLLKLAVIKIRWMLTGPVVWIAGLVTRVAVILKKYLVRPLIVLPVLALLNIIKTAISIVVRAGRAVGGFAWHSLLQPLLRGIRSVIRAIRIAIVNTTKPVIRALRNAVVNTTKPILRAGGRVRKKVGVVAKKTRVSLKSFAHALTQVARRRR